MAGSMRVRGLTIKLDADTTGVGKAFEKVNKDLKTTQDELKQINKGLKLDPSNTELLEQKQRKLSQSTQQLSKKLETLKAAQEQVGKALAETGKGQEQYDALAREIADTEAQLKAAEKAAGDFNVKLAEAGGKASELAEKTEKVSKAAQGMMAGIAAGFAVSIKAYADYEQLVGGVETLFGKAAKAVEKYADEAYMSAGVSANKYMDQVVKFSAALVQSLHGNVTQAAEIANMAVIDMADNANKMGTDLTSIQNAYQGFAKQNYTMLDNLRLGYGGTKGEMERLLEHAKELTGIHYDISNLADVFNAVHVIQVELGITGTTAYEATNTITGSVNAFKAAVENLSIGMARTDADVGGLAKNVADTFMTMAGNIAQAAGQIYANLPTGAQLAIPCLAMTAALSPVASLVSNLITIIPALTAGWSKFVGVIGGFNANIAVTMAVMAVLIPLLIKAAEAWGDMTGLEKVVTVLGALVTVATAAAIAVGAFQSAASMGIAAVAIVAGIAAIAASVNSATKRADNRQLNLPMMAEGGVLSSGSAIVGEAGPELLTMQGSRAVVQPLTNNYTTNYNTSNQPILVTLQLDRSVLARELVDPIGQQIQLKGANSVI